MEKIKTIGDSYMVAAGIPEPHPDHAKSMVEMADRMLQHFEGMFLSPCRRVGRHPDCGPSVPTRWSHYGTVPTPCQLWKSRTQIRREGNLSNL